MIIHNYKTLNKGIVAASLDIEVEQWGVTFRKCSVMEKDGKRWINFPSRKYKADDGTDQFFSYVFMERSKKDAFTKAVLEAIAAMPKPDMPMEASVNDDECPF